MYEKNLTKVMAVFALAIAIFLGSTADVYASSNSKDLTIPDNAGKLTSNCWRTTGNGTTSGNTLQWDYQVSAVYTGSKNVENIKIAWTISASLRNSASMTIGVSQDGVSAGASSSWSGVTKTAYFENTKGQKTVDYRSNVAVTPKKDYRSNTISVCNTATVKLKGISKKYSIVSSV